MATKPNARSRKTTALVVAGSIFIVVAVLIAMVPLMLNLFGGGGVKTEGIDAQSVKPASTEIDGEWKVTNRPGSNHSSAGFTIDEVLPGERRTTSGSTKSVSGTVTIEGGTLTAGEIDVDMTAITSDSDVRDNNVRRKILLTDQYPNASFSVTEPVDLSGIPEDGAIAQIELTGDLTIMDQTNEITDTFDVARSGDRLLVAGDIHINRLDYGVETPEFVAASIDEEGEINIRLNLAK